jgi:hypothetical protein
MHDDFTPRPTIEPIDIRLPWWENLQTWQDVADRHNRAVALRDEAVEMGEYGVVQCMNSELYILQNLPDHIRERLGKP